MDIINIENELIDYPRPENCTYNSKFNKVIPYIYNSGKSVSIKYVVRGKELYNISGKKYDLTPGKLLIVSHDREIETYADIKEGLNIAYAIFIELDYLSEGYHYLVNSDMNLLDNPYPNSSRFEVFEGIFNINDTNMVGELLQLTNIQKGNKVTEGFYYNLVKGLIHTMTQVKIHMHNVPALRISTKNELFRRLLNARNIILELNGKIDLFNLSREIGLSKFHFIRSFRQVYGVTPYKFATSVRINKAKKLLRNSDDPIQVISSELGFNDLQSFSKAFKKETGRPPSKFRLGQD